MTGLNRTVSTCLVTSGLGSFSVSGKIPLEEGMATHFSILARKIPWTEEPGGLQPTGVQSRPRLSDLAM